MTEPAPTDPFLGIRPGDAVTVSRPESPKSQYRGRTGVVTLVETWAPPARHGATAKPELPWVWAEFWLPPLPGWHLDTGRREHLFHPSELERIGRAIGPGGILYEMARGAIHAR